MDRDATNAQLVERWAADAGRPLATVDALRARLGTHRTGGGDGV